MPNYFDDRYQLTHRIQGLAQGMEVDIARTLENALERVSGKLAALEAKAEKTTSFTRKRQYLERQRAAVEKVLNEVYSDIAKQIKDQSIKLALEAPAMQTAMLERVGINFEILHLTKKQVTAFFESFEVESLTFNQWLDKIESSAVDRIIRETRTSLLSGETRKQATKRLQNALEISKQSAGGIAQNSFNQMYNWAELENMRHNKTKQVRWIAELDKQTCTQCAPLDGKVYSIDELPYVPPIHWRCRCYLEPVTLGEKLSADYSTRVGRIEIKGSKELTAVQVKKNVNYNDWIQSMATSSNPRHVAFAKEALGPTRFDMVRSGKLTVDRLYYHDQLRTIEELRRLI